MTVVVDSKLRVVATWNLAGVSKAQNVFKLKHQSSVDKTDEEALVACGEYIVNLMTPLQTQLSDGVWLEKVEVFEWSALHWAPVGVATPTFYGTATADRVPSGLALLLQQFKPRTGHTDKKYIAGLTEQNLAGDSWAPAIITAGDLVNVQWAAQFIGTDGVILRAGHFDELTSGFTFYVSALTSVLPSYQRRRRPGVGLT